MTGSDRRRVDFAALTERHRRELHVHCYRMLASFDEAEDAVQETFLRAWRSRERFEGEHVVPRLAVPHRDERLPRPDPAQVAAASPTLHSFAEVPWLQPYPDRLLDEVAPSDDQPDAVVVERETIELAFLAAMQVLPPRQRAALIIRDVLGWPASEAASLLETSVAAANSALQRARATMQEHLPARRSKWSAGEPSAEERGLLERFIDAHERCDAAAAVAIASEDIRISMPPDLLLFDGLASVATAPRERIRREQRRRLASRSDPGQPDADGRELPPPAGRLRVPGVQVRRPAHRGRRDRGDHDVRRRAVPGVRTAADALTSVDVGAAVAPRRHKPACDGDRDEDDERSAGGPGCADTPTSGARSRTDAAQPWTVKRAAPSAVWATTFSHSSTKASPHQTARRNADPRRDEEACVREHRERTRRGRRRERPRRLRRRAPTQQAALQSEARRR